VFKTILFLQQLRPVIRYKDRSVLEAILEKLKKTFVKASSPIQQVSGPSLVKLLAA
jgi:hypothetical protein